MAKKWRSPSAGVFRITFRFTFWAKEPTLCRCIKFCFIRLSSSFRHWLVYKNGFMETMFEAQERRDFTFNSVFSYTELNAYEIYTDLVYWSSRTLFALIIESIFLLSLFKDSSSVCYLLQFVSQYELLIHSSITLLQNHKYKGCKNITKPVDPFLKHA